uniref:Uncharacterized protein n=1 Tax=uncultured bacterium fosmid pJB28H11 TaxID=1478062 RepID=A0A0H3U7N7_9BACT|nr:hypothetical protein [uncultured bacterium fosmid pJB28H11]
MNRCADILSAEQTGEVAVFLYVENHNGDGALLAKGESCGVHNFQVVRKGFGESELVIFHSRRVLLRIGGIDTVNPGPLEECVRTDFQGAQRSAGIRREERIACPSGNEGNTASFE